MKDTIADSLNAASGLYDDEPPEIMYEDDDEIVITTAEIDAMSAVKNERPLEKETEDSLDGDREFVQSKIKDAIIQAGSMLPGLVGLAKVAESPNLYNSASKFLDSLSNLGNTLIDIRIKVEKHKSTTKPESNEPPEQSEQSMIGMSDQGTDFTGTTEEFLDRLIAMQAKAKVIIDNDC